MLTAFRPLVNPGTPANEVDITSPEANAKREAARQRLAIRGDLEYAIARLDVGDELEAYRYASGAAHNLIMSIARG